jgi:hypothetical protein
MWKADSHSTIQGNRCHLWNPTLQYRIHNSLSVDDAETVESRPTFRAKIILAKICSFHVCYDKFRGNCGSEHQKQIK